MTRKALALGVLLGLSSASGARAQGDASGAITGYAFDQGGNPLPGVTITVRSPTQIGGERKTTTGADGSYRLAALFPGVFELRAEAPGMVSYRQKAIQVGMGSVEVDPV